MSNLTTADVAKIIGRAPVSTVQLRTIILCLLVAMLDGLDTQSIAFVAPSIGKEWGVARGAFGAVFSAGLFGAMIGSLLLSPLGDRFGRRPMILVSTLGFASFSLLCAFAPDMTTLVVYRVFAGVGLGVVFPNLVALTFEYAPQRKRTLLTTIISISVPPGGVLGGLLSAFLVPRFGWQAVFVTGGVLPLLIIPLLLRYLPESIRFLASRPNRAGQLSAILQQIDPAGDYAARTYSAAPDLRRGSILSLFTEGRASSTLTLWLVFMASLFTMNFMINWLPSVVHAAGLSITQAILTTTIFNFGQIAGALGFAWAIDRLQSYATLPLAYLLCAIAIGTIGVVSHSPTALFIAIFLSGAGLLGGLSGINVVAGALYPTTARATGIGWAYGVGRIGSVIGPLVGAAIVAHGWSIERTFLFGAIPAVFAAAGTVAIVVLVARLGDDPDNTTLSPRSRLTIGSTSSAQATDQKEFN